MSQRFAPPEAMPVPPWAPACSAPPTDLPVLDLDRLVELHLCRRLPWWRAQGLARGPQEEDLDPPLPWPGLPPGWRGPGRGWVRPSLDAPPEQGLRARADWVIEAQAGFTLVLLGEPSPGRRRRLRLLGAAFQLRGNPAPGLAYQRWPPGGPSGTWLGDWPAVQALPAPAFPPAALVAPLTLLRQDLEDPCPPPRTAPQARCWDCPASRFCADHL